MRQSKKTEWFLRIAVFASALAVGGLGAWGIWQTLHDWEALMLFILFFVVLFISILYLVKRRRLGMFETR